jgi:hypothetical protein
MAQDKTPITGDASAEVQAFLEQVARTPSVKPAGARGRLLFGMDATASREPTWDVACQIQGEMFSETAALGGLDVKLVFYRGFKELKTSAWLSSSAELIPVMTRVRCLGGQTQIERLLRYAASQTRKVRISALVFVGDCMEESVDAVCAAAGELGMLSVPCFMFHEGHDQAAARTFRQVAQLTRGAYCRFDASSAAQLRQLLAAVAVYAAGGRRALADYGRRQGGAALQIAHQMH